MKLVASGEIAATRRRHASYFCELSERLLTALVADLQHARRVDEGRLREHANFRVAMDLAVRSGEPDTGLRIAAALDQFWARGWLSEGREWFTRLLNVSTTAQVTPARASALCIAGEIAYFQGDHSAAAAYLAASVASWRELSDRRGLARALASAGLVDWARGELASSQTALTLSLQLARGLGLRIWEVRSLHYLGLVAYAQGDLAAAHDWFAQSLELAKKSCDLGGQAQAYRGLGEVARRRGDLARARALHESSLVCWRENGWRWGETVALVGLGHVSLDQDDLPGACGLFVQSLAISRELGDRLGIARSLEGIAAATARSQPEHAAQLVGAAAALREAGSAPLSASERESLDRRLASAQAVLGVQQSLALMTEAKTMSQDQVVALALMTGLRESTPARAAKSARGDKKRALTKRETEVLQLVARGMTNKVIAGDLVLSRRTVERHVTNLYAKIHARGKDGAARARSLSDTLEQVLRLPECYRTRTWSVGLALSGARPPKSA